MPNGRRASGARAGTFAGLVSAAFLLSACGSAGSSAFDGDWFDGDLFGKQETPGTIGFVSGFLGAAVADEPRAALAGREVLSAGGSAADAATAMYFTLAVTMPQAAGLGGGGVCVVHESETGEVRALDFTAQAPAGGAGAAIPGNPRGFATLHARYGLLRWEQILSKGEELARFGHPLSRTLVNDFAGYETALMADHEFRRIFGGPEGRLPGEGARVEQIDLSTVLGLIRARGVGEFYIGPFARRFIEAANEAGGGLSVEVLRDFRARWVEPLKVQLGFDTAHFAISPAAASVSAAQMMAMLEDDGDFDGADPTKRAHLMAETGLRTFADRAVWMGPGGHSRVDGAGLVGEARIETLMRSYSSKRHTPARAFNPAPQARPESSSATGFVAVDLVGNAVACAVTMNSRFGSGRMAKGTGMFLAAAPGPDGTGPSGLGAMIVSNLNVGELRLAASATGGVTAPTALANVAAHATWAGQPLKSIVASPRVHHGGKPDVTYVEQGMAANVMTGLTRLGHTTAETAPIGRVNAVRCTGPIMSQPETCEMANDPRGTGLAAGTMR